MNKMYVPSMYAKDIYSINYQKLKDNNIHYLLFDLDNTIADKNMREPDNNIIDFFNNLKKDFTIFIVSNALKHRAIKFTKKLNIKTYYISLKPLKITYNKIIKKYNLKVSEIAAIGDEIFTDILGANKMNIKSILVDKVSTQEYLLTKISRIRENYLFKKTQIIKRGEYYE